MSATFQLQDLRGFEEQIINIPFDPNSTALITDFLAQYIKNPKDTSLIVDGKNKNLKTLKEIFDERKARMKTIKIEVIHAVEGGN